MRQKGLKEDIFQTPVWAEYKKEKGLHSLEDLYCRLAYGKILTKDFLALFLPASPPPPAPARPEVKPLQREGARGGQDICPVVVDGLGSVMVHFARCCRPIPGDLITGFISRGRGIMVHRHSCKALLSLDSERYVDVQWSRSQDLKDRHLALIEAVVHDSPGVLSSLSGVFAEQNVNILNLKVSGSKDLKSTCLFSVELKDLDQLTNVLKSLRSLKPVIHARRSEKSF